LLRSYVGSAPASQFELVGVANEQRLDLADEIGRAQRLHKQ
jgi:hypothetical protein